MFFDMAIKLETMTGGSIDDKPIETQIILKVTLREDMIVSPAGDSEIIGPLPKGVGLERLRCDGKKIIDLITLETMWVRNVGGVFELHAVSVPGSQRVVMTYADRKRLYADGDVIRVRTEKQDEEQKQTESARIVENRLLKTEAMLIAKWLTPNVIDAHIDTVFKDLNTDQKSSLRRLYKAVSFLSRSYF
jgi:hypothetical protein